MDHIFPPQIFKHFPEVCVQCCLRFAITWLWFRKCIHFGICVKRLPYKHSRYTFITVLNCKCIDSPANRYNHFIILNCC